MPRIIRYRRDKANDYKPHDDGSESFSSFAISDQIRRPVILGAEQVIGIARGIAPKSSGGYSLAFKLGEAKTFMFKPKSGPLQRRAVVEVINDDPKAVAMEFGSGEQSPGGGPRVQGGNNRPFRTLGTAGARVGDFHAPHHE